MGTFNIHNSKIEQLNDSGNNYKFVQTGGVQHQSRLFVEGIDSFAKVREVAPADVAPVLKNGYLDLAEDVVQRAIEEILGVSFHKMDWGGETNDLYTTHVIVDGARTPTAFMLKGNGLRRPVMELKHCGKNGDQVIRLFQSPAELFVIQFVGTISETVIQHAHSEVARLKTEGREVRFVTLGGQDTARLLQAYGKLPAKPLPAPSTTPSAKAQRSQRKRKTP